MTLNMKTIIYLLKYTMII
ncbi:hypothetical protein, partial [Plasmodium yoelii yoelii]